MAGRGLGFGGNRTMVSAMVTLDNLTVSYRQHPALHHVSGHFAAGSLTAVVGPNGAGKSTLCKSIMGLLPRSGGQVTTATPRARLAYLPQLAEMDRGFPMDVRDAVLLGCWPSRGAWGGVNDAQWAAVGAALRAVGLEGLETRPIGTLSSGQFQRVLFARLLVQDARLILLDEPFSAIDSQTTAALLALIHQWHAQGRTVIAVLHDDAQVRAHFPQTLLLAREAVAWGPTMQVMTESNLARARSMAQAWDDNAEACRIDGEAATSPAALHPPLLHKAAA
jgi:zinc/manganese transport system ATP-binding protein